MGLSTTKRRLKTKKEMKPTGGMIARIVGQLKHYVAYPQLIILQMICSYKLVSNRFGQKKIMILAYSHFMWYFLRPSGWCSRDSFVADSNEYCLVWCMMQTSMPIS